MRAIVTARPEPHRVVDDDGTAVPYRQGLRIDDRVALEAALDVASEVTAVGIGGDDARKCIRSALERGADRGIHVAFDPVEHIIGEKYVHVLARVVGNESPDGVFVGEQGALAGTEIGGMLAADLEWPALTQVTKLGEEIAEDEIDLDGDELGVQRKLAIGRQELLRVTPPAVFGIETSYANPRRAPLDVVIEGRKTDIETIDLESIAPNESQFSMSVGNTTIERITPNERWGRGRPPRQGSVEERIYRMLDRGSAESTSSGELLDDPPEEAAARVVEYLEDRDLV